VSAVPSPPSPAQSTSPEGAGAWWPTRGQHPRAGSHPAPTSPEGGERRSPSPPGGIAGAASPEGLQEVLEGHQEVEGPFAPPEAPAVSAPRLDTFETNPGGIAGKGLRGARWRGWVQLELSNLRQRAWTFCGAEAKWQPLPSERLYPRFVETPDGTYAIHPDDQHLDPTKEAPPPDPAQLRLFETEGAQMTFSGWRAMVGRNLDKIGKVLGGKFGRGLRREGRDLQFCGEFAQRSTCTSCGTERTILLSTCNSRVCPSCERVRAAGKVRALVEKFEELRKRRPCIRRLDGSFESFRLRLVTLTLRFDVTDIAEFYGDRMRERRADLLRLFDLAWDEIARGPHGERLREAAAHWGIEVGCGGLVHLHALMWSPFVDVAAIRAQFFAEGFEGLANIDVQLIKPEKKGGIRASVREACKYIAKGSGPRRSVGAFFDRTPSARMDPGLAAIIVASWKGLHLSGTRGAIRGLAERAEELEPTIQDGGKCACGSSWAAQVWLHREMLRSIDGVGKFGIKGSASALEKLAHGTGRKREKNLSAKDVAVALHASRGPPGGPDP